MLRSKHRFLLSLGKEGAGDLKAGVCGQGWVLSAVLQWLCCSVLIRRWWWGNLSQTGSILKLFGTSALIYDTEAVLRTQLL